MLSSLGVKKFNLAISPSSFTHGGAYYHGISVTVPLAKFTDTLLPPRTQVLALQELSEGVPTDIDRSTNNHRLSVNLASYLRIPMRS